MRPFKHTNKQQILNPGFIGGFLLPVLGALPDSAIIFVSGFSGTKEVIKEEIVCTKERARGRLVVQVLTSL